MSALVVPAISITASSIVALVAIFYVAVFRRGLSKADKLNRKGPRSKDRVAVLRLAKRRLAKNPKDVKSLLSLAELYYEEQDFQNSYPYYEKLIDLCATVPELDEVEITLKHAVSALKIKKTREITRRSRHLITNGRRCSSRCPHTITADRVTTSRSVAAGLVPSCIVVSYSTSTLPCSVSRTPRRICNSC